LAEGDVGTSEFGKQTEYVLGRTLSSTISGGSNSALHSQPLLYHQQGRFSPEVLSLYFDVHHKPHIEIGILLFGGYRYRASEKHQKSCL
jgi:hypothetical protein